MDDPLVRLEDDPETDTVHHPYTAMNQGYDAASQDIPQSLNPYVDTHLEHWWDAGYDEFFEED